MCLKLLFYEEGVSSPFDQDLNPDFPMLVGSVHFANFEFCIPFVVKNFFICILSICWAGSKIIVSVLDSLVISLYFNFVACVK